MRTRYILAGIGVLVLAAALAIPALAQRGPGGPGAMGPGMMGFGWGNQSTAPVTSIDTAAARVRDALASAPGNGDLVVAEVMEFSNHFYVLVKEKSTGTGALELLVERNGFVHLEYGPAMMWNAKYGHMGGWNPSVGTMTVTAQEALAVAQEWLEANLPGTTVDDAETFYGYYTVHVLTDGQVTGMLSVNGYTGQVWFHTWHGAFIGMQSLEEKPTD